MKLRSLQLHHFGHFEKRAFPFQEARFVLLYGPNESGKSTLLQALRESLFGFSPSTYSLGGEMAADIVSILRDGTPLQFRRRRGRKRVVEGTIGSDNSPVDEHSVKELLGGLDTATYSNLFGFSLKELTLGEASLKGSSLTEALLGNSQSSSIDWKSVRKKLQADRDALMTSRGRTQKIPELLRALRENQKQVDDQTIKPKVYRELQWQIDQHRDAQESLRRHRDQLALELRVAQRNVEAWPIAFRLDTLRKKIQHDSLPSKLTSDWAIQWRSTQEAIRVHSDELQGMNLELEALNRQRSTIPSNHPMLDRLETLRLLAASIQTQQDNLQRLQSVESRLELLNQQANAIQSGLPFPTSQLSIPPQIAKKELKEIVTPWQSESRAVEQIENDLKKSHLKLEMYQARIAKQMGGNAEEATVYSIERLTEAHQEFQRALMEWSALDGIRMDCDRLHSSIRSRCSSEEPILWDSLPSEADMESAMRELDRWSQCRHDLTRERQQVERERLQAENAIEELDAQGSLPSMLEMDELRKQRDQWMDALRDFDRDHGREEDIHPLFSSARIDEGMELRGAIGDTSASEIVDTEIRGPRGSGRTPGTGKSSKSVKRQSIHQKLRQVTNSLDSMVSRMLNEAQRFAKRDQLARVVDELRKREELLHQQRLEIESQRDQADRRWKDRWQSLGVNAESIEIVKPWVSDVRQWRLHKAQIDLAQQKLDLSIEHLDLRCIEGEKWAGLDHPVSDASILPSRKGVCFADRVQKIHEQLELLQRSRNQVESWQDLVQQESESLSQLELAYRESADRCNQWKSRFQEWLKELSLPEGSSAVSAEGWLDQWIELQGLENEQRSAQAERKLLQQRLEEFCQRVEVVRANEPSQATCDSTTLSAADQETALISELAPMDLPMRFQEILDWKNQAESAASQQQQLATLSVRLEERESSQRAKQTQLDQMIAQRQRMLDELGESDGTKIDDWAKLASENAEQQIAMSQYEDQLRLVFGSDDYHSHTENLLANDIESFQGEVDRLQGELSQCEDGIQEKSKQLGGLEQQLKDLEREDLAMSLSMERQNLWAQLDRNAEQWMVLSIADALLEQAVDAFRRQQQNGVLEDVIQIFRRLTRDRYVDVRSDPMDPTKFVAVDANGDEKSPEQMSTGTREQLYLAIRLAYVEHYCRVNEPLPLVLDDCFVNFDDSRLEATLRTLNDQKSVEQVILLSCHERTIQAVKSIVPDATFLTLS